MVLLSLECAIVGQEGTFEVKIDDGERVSALKKAIKAENSKTITCDAKDLQLFLATKEKDGEAKEGEANGTGWMDEDSAKAVVLDEHGRPQGLEQMKSTLWLKNAKYFGENFTPGEGQVHVLVVAPKRAGEDVAIREPTAPRTAVRRHPERIKRWDAINEMVRQKNQDGNEKVSKKTSDQITGRKRPKKDVDSSVAYSSLSWADLEPILTIEEFDLQAKTVPDDVVKRVQSRIGELISLYGDIFTGKEAKRQLFIMAVIEAVCLQLGDVKILVEEEVDGKNVSVHGRFEFVLKRGKKRISIVEAKRDDIAQGVAQNVAGLEALCDVEGLEKAVGIVTDYVVWTFISDEDERIRRMHRTLDLRQSVPSDKSLKMILGMIVELLSDSIVAVEGSELNH